MSILAYMIKIIDRYGAIASVPIGFIILYFGSVSWFFILLSFFVTASLFTKYKQKQKIGLSEENKDVRGWKNVLANGGPSASFAILFYLFNNDAIFALSFAGSISFAMSDTIATEIGMLSKAKPRSILTGKEIEIGGSGGITIQGEIAAFTGSILIGTLCMLLLYGDGSLRPHIIFLASIVGGMIATNTDSVFGATIQAKYRCLNCKKYLEKKIMHCNFLTVQEKGIGRIDNNVVNFLSAILGALISASFIIIYR